jgi:hypothetical protein
MRGIVQWCASPVRMSRTELALLSRVLPTASQVMTSDSKSTIVEAKYIDWFDVAKFASAVGPRGSRVV